MIRARSPASCFTVLELSQGGSAVGVGIIRLRKLWHPSFVYILVASAEHGDRWHRGATGPLRRLALCPKGITNCYILNIGFVIVFA